MIRLIIPPRGHRKIGDAISVTLVGDVETTLITLASGNNEASVISWIRAVGENNKKAKIVLCNPNPIAICFEPRGEVYPLHALIPAKGRAKIKAFSTLGQDLDLSFYGWVFPDPDLFFGIGDRAS